MDFSGCDRCHPSGVQGRFGRFSTEMPPLWGSRDIRRRVCSDLQQVPIGRFSTEMSPLRGSRDIRRRVCRDLQQIPTSTVGWVEREKPRTLSFPETVPVCDMLRISVFSEPQQASDLRRNNTISKSLYCMSAQTNST